MQLKHYTQRDTALLKGLAIALICFHNIFHHIAPSPGENEFFFSSGTIHTLFNQISSTPGEWFNLLLSYFGHFGVQIFIFLSGYGLTMSMLKNERRWESFMLARLKKLYPLLLTGIIAFVLSTMLIQARFPDANEWTEIGYKLLFLQTFIPNSALSLSGPWWFFGLIFQLYVLFPLLFHLTKKYDWKAFVGISLLSYACIYLALYTVDTQGDRLLMMNAPGHLPEFGLGILLAMPKERKLPWWVAIITLAAFCLGNFYQAFYPLTFIAVTLLCIFAYQGIKTLRFRIRPIANAFVWLGDISMLLFAVHGFLRSPFEKIGESLVGPWGHFFTALLFFITALGIALAARVLYNLLIRLFAKINLRESKASHIVGRICQVALIVFYTYVISFYISTNYNHTQHELAIDTVVESGNITPDDTYVTLLRTDLHKNHNQLHLEGQFNYHNQCDSPMPLLIIDIKGLLWQKFDLPISNEGTQTFHLDCYFNRPLNRMLKGKTLKVYFWNNNNGSSQFDSVNIHLTD